MAEDLFRIKGVYKSLDEADLLSRFFEAGFALFCIFTSDGTFIRVNKLWEEVLGYQPEELIGKSVADFIYKKDAEATRKAISEVSGNKQATDVVNRFRCRDGGYQYLQWQLIRFEDLIYACAQDVTPSADKDISTMQAKIDRLESMLDSIPEAVFYKDLNGVYLGCNPQCAEILGMANDGIIGKTDFDLFDRETAGLIREADKRICANRQRFRSEMWYDFGGGVKVLHETLKAPFIDSQGNVAGIIGISRDITENKRWEKEIQYLSFHDQMTGLYNRRFYEEELRRIDVERNLPITIIMADVDSLKFVNDAFGHDEGDLLIKQTAKALKSSCRSEDIVARIGGDEFALVLPHTNSATAEKILERINVLISKEKIGMIKASVSFGSATKTKRDQDIHEIIKQAEKTMYRNKLARRSEIKVNSINDIISTLFEKSQREREHSRRVGDICREIAIKMRLDRETVNKVRLAGIMHDIGKIDIEDSILNKKDKLSEYERKMINNHPELGYRILCTSKEFIDIAVFVGQHHENWDGSGYPKGLRGEQILLPARIIAVAEAYDSMVNPSYKKPLCSEKIVAELRRCAGKEFDPVVVEIFVEEVLSDPGLELHL
ncbi:MAG: diguanylate cyclase [Clostridia bacterium]|nr:diguanylate cyclase [Clostridia bacterium]